MTSALPNKAMQPPSAAAALAADGQRRWLGAVKPRSSPARETKVPRCAMRDADVCSVRDACSRSAIGGQSTVAPFSVMSPRAWRRGPDGGGCAPANPPQHPTSAAAALAADGQRR